jgi:hypothetical protein
MCFRLVRSLFALLLSATAACSGESIPFKAPAGAARAPSGLGAHALATHDQNKGTSPCTTAPIATQPTGSLLLAVNMGRNVNFGTPTDSHGNIWSLIGKRHPYADGPFFNAMWAAGGARGGSGHTLTATKPADPADEISLAFIEVKNAAGIEDTAYAYPKLGSPNTPGSVTVAGPATLIAVWGGAASELTHTAVPSDGFQIIDSYLTLGPTSGVQIAIAAKQVSAAGTYSVTWTATPVQRAACYLIAVQ